MRPPSGGMTQLSEHGSLSASRVSCSTTPSGTNSLGPMVCSPWAVVIEVIEGLGSLIGAARTSIDSVWMRAIGPQTQLDPLGRIVGIGLPNAAWGWNSDNGVSDLMQQQGFGRSILSDAINESWCLGACVNCVRWHSRFTLPVCMQVGILTDWEGDDL